MNMRNKLLSSYIFLILFTIGLSTIIIGGISKTAILTEVKEKNQNVTDLVFNLTTMRRDFLLEKVKSDLYLVDKQLSTLGDFTINHDNKVNVNGNMLPSLYVSKKLINNSTAFVSDIYNSINAYCTIFVFDNDNFTRISSNLNFNHDIPLGSTIDQNSEVYSKLINNEMFFGESELLGDAYTAGYKPLLDSSGSIVGAICLVYENLDNSLENTINGNRLGTGGYVYILDSTGKALFHPNYKDTDLSNEYFIEEILQNKSGYLDYKFEGKKKIATYKYFEPWDWYIITTCNFDDFNSSSYTIHKNIIIIGTLITALSICLALILSKKFVAPIKELKNCVELVSSGDLTARSRIDSKDELGILSDSLNTLIDSQEKHVNKILEYDKAKNEFFANISHELRTPLNIIFSTSQLFSFYLKDSKDEFSYKLIHYNNTIRQNCYRLLKLVNNIIDINKLDSGFLDITLQNANIVQVVEDITLSTADYITSKNKSIIFDTDNEEIITAIDPQHMERIILNLISNAVKFTREEDLITVTVLDKFDHVQITVQDTGIGIAEDEQAKIFERFKQVDPVLSRNHEGSGIGLSLVKSLVELHNGTITVKSSYGIGTTFTINLPILKVDDHMNDLNKFETNDSVEKIEIEFSDIYS